MYFVIIATDGRNGYLPGAPYDAIHVGAAAKSIPQAVSRNRIAFICKCYSKDFALLVSWCFHGI